MSIEASASDCDCDVRELAVVVVAVVVVEVTEGLGRIVGVAVELGILVEIPEENPANPAKGLLEDGAEGSFIEDKELLSLDGVVLQYITVQYVIYIV